MEGLLRAAGPPPGWEPVVQLHQGFTLASLLDWTAGTAQVLPSGATSLRVPLRLHDPARLAAALGNHTELLRWHATSPFGLASLLAHAAVVSSSPDWAPVGQVCSAWFHSVSDAAEHSRYADVFGDGRYWAIALEATISLVGGNHGHRGIQGKKRKVPVTSLQSGEAWAIAV